jgi:hypothetical protein
MSSRGGQRQGTWAQLRETYSFAKKHVSLLPLKLLGIFGSVVALMYGIGYATGHPVAVAVLGIPTGFLCATYWFGKAAERAAYASIAGQLGAAASVTESMRGGWSTTPGVGVDRTQNLVHRVVGRPGIILVGEGQRPGPLLGEQRKAHARFVPGVTIHEIVVGEGGVELTSLQKHIRKLPKSLRPREVTELRHRLDALPKTALPIPKGPLPQGRRMPRR